MAQSALEGISAGESPYREPKSRCFRFRLIAVVHQRLLYGVSTLKIPLNRLRTALTSFRKTWLWIIAAASARPEIPHTLVSSACIAR